MPQTGTRCVSFGFQEWLWQYLFCVHKWELYSCQETMTVFNAGIDSTLIKVWNLNDNE